MSRVERGGHRGAAWKAFFDDVYLQLNGPFFDEATSRREVAAAVEMLALPLGARVLDAPCGWGRHAALLEESGMRVLGADLSPALLRHAARRRSSEAGRLVAADLRRLPFRDACFDAALNIGSNLAVFAADEDALLAVRETRRVLVPGGGLLLESMHRDEVVAAYARRDRWTLPDGTQVRVRRRFDPASGISRERMRWRRGGEGGEKIHALRLRTVTELIALLRRGGFAEVELFGDWDRAPLRLASPRVVAVARA